MTREPTTPPLSYRAQRNRRVTLQVTQPKALLRLTFVFRLYWAFFITICSCVYFSWMANTRIDFSTSGIQNLIAFEHWPHCKRANDSSAYLNSLMKSLSNFSSHTAQGSPPVLALCFRLCWAFFSTIHIFLHIFHEWHRLGCILPQVAYYS